MSINVIWGANQTTDIKSLAKLGIKQVFIGYIENSSKYYSPNLVLLNRRGTEANFTDEQKLRDFLSCISDNNITATVTFNGLYTPKQYNYIMNDIEFVSKFNSVEGIIVNDIGLLLRLKQNNYNKKIIISTGGTIFNSSSVEFYKQLGAKEFVLDRQLKPEEIIPIIEKHQDVFFEIFLLFGNCLFVDGFCSFLHIDTQYDTFGNFICPCEMIKGEQKNNKFSVYGKFKNIAFKDINSQFACNLCLIEKLKKYKNIKYKIVTRNFTSLNYGKLIQQFEFIKNESVSPKKIFKDIFGVECNNTGCYYSYI